jgi:hypothetical protein
MGMMAEHPMKLRTINMYADTLKKRRSITASKPTVDKRNDSDTQNTVEIQPSDKPLLSFGGLPLYL